MERPVKSYPMNKVFDYNEVIKFIENKYKIKTRDYAYKPGEESDFDTWCNSKNYGKKDPNNLDRNSSQIWYAEWKKEIA